MIESGKAVHFERAFMTGSEKGYSHVYSHQVHHDERFAEVIRHIFSNGESRNSNSVGGTHLATGESLEWFQHPLSVVPHWTGRPRPRSNLSNPIRLVRRLDLPAPDDLGKPGSVWSDSRRRTHCRMGIACLVRRAIRLLHHDPL